MSHVLLLKEKNKEEGHQIVHTAGASIPGMASNDGCEQNIRVFARGICNVKPASTVELR